MLTPRLETVFSKISGRTCADIGTDHAYIPIELLKSGRVDSAIACDINEGPLKIARANVEKNSLSEKIELRLASGLEGLCKSEVETVIIAGMGGVLISEILDADEEKSHSYRELILQPMNAQSELRKYLASHNFKVIDEDLALEGFKVYNVMTVCTGVGLEYTELESHIPPCLSSHAHFGSLLAKKKREFEKILSGLKKAAQKDSELIEHYERLMREMEERYQEFLG